MKKQKLPNGRFYDYKTGELIATCEIFQMQMIDNHTGEAIDLTRCLKPSPSEKELVIKNIKELRQSERKEKNHLILIGIRREICKLEKRLKNMKKGGTFITYGI